MCAVMCASDVHVVSERAKRDGLLPPYAIFNRFTYSLYPHSLNGYFLWFPAGSKGFRRHHGDVDLHFFLAGVRHRSV